MWDDLDKLGPVLAMGGVATLILVWGFLPRGRIPAPRNTALLAVALLGPILAAAWALSLLTRDEAGFAFANSMVLDDFSYFFHFLFAGIAAAVLFSSQDYGKRFGDRQPEYYALVLLASGAMMLLAASRDLILIYIALELTSISQYIMAALQRDERSSEAGIKYLLLGAVASAVILYGMAFLFGMTGSTRLIAPAGEPSIASAIAERGEEMRAGLVLSVVFLIAGFGFKMAVVPFQMWVPDVYEGSPAPVAAFLSVASKAAGFAAVMRIFFEGLTDASISGDWADIFAVVAAVSMSVGNVLALVQSNIKRLLGYSSIAQAGNFMVGLAAISAAGGLEGAASGVLFFLAAYAFTNMAAFVVVIVISDRTGSDLIADYGGMWQRAPVLALALTLALVSLTGIPPTVGFIAKVYIFNAAVESDLVWLVVIAVLNSVVSAFYYLRIAGTMFLAEPRSRERIATSYPVRLALAVAAVGILALGIVPSPLLEVAQDAAAVFAE
ncbi:MAG TPA: NADH-quinone oxidoreductase subunit N [Dehalococcoidia bacterium]|nr:NADH-quinone oxidoreductase subunit N [Dehalococcoidia bacterium]